MKTYEQRFNEAWQREFAALSEHDQAAVLAAPLGRTASRLATAADAAVLEDELATESPSERQHRCKTERGDDSFRDAELFGGAA